MEHFACENKMNRIKQFQNPLASNQVLQLRNSAAANDEAAPTMMHPVITILPRKRLHFDALNA